MAYICPYDGKCQGCEHYRLDPENRRYACFVKQDEEKKQKQNRTADLLKAILLYERTH